MKINQGMAGRGMAGLGKAWQGKARQGIFINIIGDKMKYMRGKSKACYIFTADLLISGVDNKQEVFKIVKSKFPMFGDCYIKSIIQTARFKVTGNLECVGHGSRVYRQREHILDQLRKMDVIKLSDTCKKLEKTYGIKPRTFSRYLKLLVRDKEYKRIVGKGGFVTYHKIDSSFICD